MDGLEEKLNKILSDPKALGSVMEIAKSLGGGEETKVSDRADYAADRSDRQEASDNGLGDLLGSVDPAMIGKMLSLFGEFNKGDDKRTQLLYALKPYMRKERQGKIEKATKLVKIAKTARVALSGFGGD